MRSVSDECDSWVWGCFHAAWGLAWPQVSTKKTTDTTNIHQSQNNNRVTVDGAAVVDWSPVLRHVIARGDALRRGGVIKWENLT